MNLGKGPKDPYLHSLIFTQLVKLWFAPLKFCLPYNTGPAKHNFSSITYVISSVTLFFITICKAVLFSKTIGSVYKNSKPNLLTGTELEQ